MKRKEKRKKVDPPFSFKNSDGIKYEVVWRSPSKSSNAWGVCDNPVTNKNPKILLDPKMSKRLKLSVVIHEFAHAFFWDKSEREVYKYAASLSKFIRKYNLS